ESFDIPRGRGHGGGDVELGEYGRNSGELSLEAFLKKVQELEKQYAKLDNLLRKLQRMDKDVDEVKKTAHYLKTKVEELDKENLANRQKPGCGKGSAVDRSRTATTINLKKKLKDKMAEFQTLRTAIHEEYRDVVERRVFTVTGKRADEETIDRLIETGDSEQIFQKAIQEQGRGQIFMDIAVLVDAQGDMLNNIESQVTSAVDHVQRGNDTLLKAKKLQKNSRKWMCIAIMIFLIIVTFILLSVLKPWVTHQA
ncbi:hypothetical protein TSUD_146850, partial [Trifolium subterraneum]